MNEWIATKDRLPDNTILVETKVADKRGDHSKVLLARHKHLWYNPSVFKYVYYQPTHWRKINQS